MWLSFSDLLQSLSLILSYVSFMVNLLEPLKLFFISSNHFIELLISIHLIINSFIRIVLLKEQIFQFLIPLLVCRSLVVIASCLDNNFINKLLLCCLVEDVLFHFGVGDQSVYSYFIFLTNSICTILSLLIHHWVEVRVKDNHSVSNL